jgi:peptide/nickel transport system substrate-binding protein
MNKKGTFWSYLVLCLVVVLLATQCGPTATPEATQPPAGGEVVETSAPPPTQPPPTEAAANVFIYAHPTTFPDFDPAKSFSNDSVVMSNCYEGLTFYNPPGSAEILSPWLATSWESSADAMEWTFHLRDGVKFQNGKPLNAAAVKAAIEKTIEVGVGAAYIWGAVDSIEAVDDLTVKFKLSYAAPLDLVASSGYGAWIYDVDVYNEKGSDWYNEGNCMGTGPYTIESYERGSRLVMTRNEDYWGGWKAGQYDKIVFEIREDPVVRQQMIEAGTASFTYDTPPDNAPALDARPDVVVYTNPSFQNLVGLLNTQKPPLDNKLVRQALAYTVPYSAFIQGVMGDRAVQAYGPVPHGMWGFSDQLPQYTYDLDKAKQLLTEAGYPDGGFDLLYTFATGDLDEQQLGELWKAELAKLGINLEVQGMNWEAQWDLGKSDPLKAQDVFVMYWWPTYVTPYDFLFNMFHSEDTILFNLGYYRNPEFDTLIDDANVLSGSDRAKATEMFIEAQKMLIDDAASIFFYDRVNQHVARADVQGYVDNPAYPHVVFVYQLTQQ